MSVERKQDEISRPFSFKSWILMNIRCGEHTTTISRPGRQFSVSPHNVTERGESNSDGRGPFSLHHRELSAFLVDQARLIELTSRAAGSMSRGVKKKTTTTNRRTTPLPFPPPPYEKFRKISRWKEKSKRERRGRGSFGEKTIILHAYWISKSPP